MSWNTSKRQYYAALWVNLVTLSYGTSLGWSSAGLLVLESADSPLESGPVTKEQSSWIGALLCIGGVFGILTSGWLSDQIGRKPSLMICAVPQIMSWLLIIIAKNPVYLYVSRFLCGSSSGAALLLVPIYVTEISDDVIRGKLGSFLRLSVNTGVFFSFVIGYYLSYNAIPYVLVTVPIGFLIGMLFFPETPHYLKKNCLHEKAEISIKFFRNNHDDPSCKIDLNKDCQDDTLLEKKSEINKPVTLRDFTNPVARKALLIGVSLLGICQLSGVFAITNFVANIFDESGSDLSPTLSAMIVGLIQIIGSFISTLLVERAGRKILLACSTLGTGVGLIGLGLYACLADFGIDMSKFNWMPVVSLSFTIFVASFGIMALPMVVTSEVMPPKIRSLGSVICLTFSFSLAFLLVKYLHFFIYLLHFYGCMFMFAAFCVIGCSFILLYVPETKGKSLEQISEMLK